MNEQIAALEKRIADLEADLKAYKELEWDRLYIHDMMSYIKSTDFEHTPIGPPSEADKLYKREYYRRVAVLENVRKNMHIRVDISKKQRAGILAKTAEEIDILGRPVMCYLYTDPPRISETCTAIGVTTDGMEIHQYHGISRREAELIASATQTTNDTL